MTTTADPGDPAEVAAIQTPEGEPDGELIDPAGVSPYTEFGTTEASEEVLPE